MPFPEPSRLELPILQELKAAGGRDHPRYLYQRIIRYFPMLTAQDFEQKTESGRSRWHRVVQRVAHQLMLNGDLKRAGTNWELTPQGARRVDAEELQISLTDETLSGATQTTSHKQAQQMLMEIAFLLGKYGEMEFDYYDVVWRDSSVAPRLSHVFEVQISGNVDSALTRLKHAYDTQRSLLYLVIADERDQRFAGKRLSGSFHEILDLVNIIRLSELERLYEALASEKSLLEKLALKK